MQNNFLEYIQKNGPEAFDKMAADLAKQLNDAKDAIDTARAALVK